MMASPSPISFVTRTFFVFKNDSMLSCSSRAMEVKVYSGPDFCSILRSNVRAEVMAPPTLLSSVLPLAREPLYDIYCVLTEKR